MAIGSISNSVQLLSSMAYQAIDKISLIAFETWLITRLYRKRHPTQHHVKS